MLLSTIILLNSLLQKLKERVPRCYTFIQIVASRLRKFISKAGVFQWPRRYFTCSSMCSHLILSRIAYPRPNTSFSERGHRTRVLSIDGRVGIDRHDSSVSSAPDVSLDSRSDSSISGGAEGNVDMIPSGNRQGSSSQSGNVSCVGPTFYPIAPTEFERYERPDTVPDAHINYDIACMTNSFSKSCPRRWSSYVHPEGSRYFRSESSMFTVLTDANMYETKIEATVNDHVEQMTRYLMQHQCELRGINSAAGTLDLVLDLTTSNDKMVCGYYFAYHANRTIFWLDNFHASGRLWCNIGGITSKAQILHEIHSQYWYHCALFSCDRIPSPEVIGELKDSLVHAIGDSLLSPTAIVPFSVEVMEKALALLQHVPADAASCRTGFGGFSRIVYILLKKFAHERFLHFHGEPVARLDQGVSVYDKATARQRSARFRVITHLLFNAPGIHLKEIEYMLSDELLSATAWKSFIEKVSGEWTDLTLYSTVLLNANVAFLSIQSVDSSDRAATGEESPIRIAIYLSVIWSLGSISFGLLLLRRNRSRASLTSEKACDILRSCRHSIYGYENLAILHSMPFALLLWGMVAFLSAILIMCLWETGPYTRTFTVAACFALLSAAVFSSSLSEGAEGWCGFRLGDQLRHWTTNFVARASPEVHKTICLILRQALPVTFNRNR